MLYICTIVLKTGIILICLWASFYVGVAQEKSKKPSTTALRNTYQIIISYARHKPMGSMGNRFGNSNTLGLGGAYKFGHNWQAAAGFDVVFGSTVKENTIFDSMTGPSNSLIDAQGNLAVVRLYERGYHFHFDFGKVINLDRIHKNSGLLLTGGMGMMQHKIKFQFTRTILPQLENGMYKGYDRLSNGFMLRGFIGYQRMEPDEMLSFYAGLEYLKGFNRNRRELNYDTRLKDTQLRNDILFGFKIGVIIQLAGRKTGTKKGEEEKFYN